MKLGRFAVLRAQLKIREMRFVLTSRDAYITEKPKLTCEMDLVSVTTSDIRSRLPLEGFQIELPNLPKISGFRK